MTKKEAAEKLQQELKLLCHGCMHPQEVGWCKNHCKLPEAFDMAIEALTDTSNALDTIYRQAAIEAIRKLPNAGIHWFVSAEAVFDALLKLPSAQSESQWTSCNERPPKEGQDILAYRIFGEDERIIPANYSHGCWFDCHMNCSVDHIVAWMPLPKPWKGKKE